MSATLDKACEMGRPLYCIPSAHIQTEGGSGAQDSPTLKARTEYSILNRLMHLLFTQQLAQGLRC